MTREEAEKEIANLRGTLRRIIAMTLDDYIIEIAKHALGEDDGKPSKGTEKSGNGL
jgi:hypothetical protein